jgi:hypothetical protein
VTSSLKPCCYLVAQEENKAPFECTSKNTRLSIIGPNRENGHSFFPHTTRQSYVAHVLPGSEFVQKSHLYVLEMRSLFCKSFLLGYSSDIISAVSRFEFTNRTHWERADSLLSSYVSFTKLPNDANVVIFVCAFIYYCTSNLEFCFTYIL